MKINTIKIINAENDEDIITLRTEDEILSIFGTYTTISTDDIFVIKDSMYVPKEIVLKLIDKEYEVLLYAKFLRIISND